MINKKINELMRMVGVTTEILDGESIDELIPQLAALAVIYPNDGRVITMMVWIKEAKQEIGIDNNYENLKQHLIPCLMEEHQDIEYAEYLADGIAYRSAYFLKR